MPAWLLQILASSFIHNDVIWGRKRPELLREKDGRPGGRKPKRFDYKEWSREYSNHNSQKCERCRKRSSRKGTVVILLLFVIAGFMAVWMSNKLPRDGLITDVIRSAKFATLLNMNQSAQTHCYDAAKHLLMEYSRMQKHVRNMLRIRKTIFLSSRTREDLPPEITYSYIQGMAVKGSGTEEWQARLALWGVVPLWRASPPISTILALRKPVPSDCWPFTGSYGEIIIQLAYIHKIHGVSVEHIRPDTARSAPKDFVLYGILLNNTEVKLMENQYESRGPAKQYYRVITQAQVKSVLLRILSNQGNPKYTCVYRFYVYGEMLIN